MWNRALLVLCYQMNFSSLLLCLRSGGGAMKEVFPTPFRSVALTNGLSANGRKGANRENLDLISVSHSVCVLFSDFC